MLHRQAIIIHARKRAKERFDVDLTDSLKQKIVFAIQSNQTVPLASDIDTRRKHVVNVNGKLLTVVYSRNLKEIVTVLTTNNKIIRCSSCDFKTELTPENSRLVIGLNVNARSGKIHPCTNIRQIRSEITGWR